MKKEPPLSQNLPGVVYSHLTTRQVVGEQFVIEHGLSWIVSGYLQVVDAGEVRIFGAGDIIFYCKNFLARFIKLPDGDKEFRSITVVFSKDSLTGLGEKYSFSHDEGFMQRNAVLKLKSNVLLSNYFGTLMPYFDASLPEELIHLKRQEALMLLLQVKPQLKQILFDFGQPDKIDLASFMQQNFRFNVEMKRFAYLSGRSLATFKRDFQKVFHTTPNRWLQQRRLEEAYYLLKEENRRPSDVYQEVGFESFAHFSDSFKRLYGVNPSNIHAADS